MKLLDIFLLAGMIIIIGLLFFLAGMILFTDGPKCLDNPIGYFKEQTNNTCFCFSTFEERARALNLVNNKYSNINYTLLEDAIVRD